VKYVHAIFIQQEVYKKRLLNFCLNDSGYVGCCWCCKTFWLVEVVDVVDIIDVVDFVGVVDVADVVDVVDLKVKQIWDD